MPRYISLLNLTDQGIRDVKSVPQRIEACVGMFQELGVTPVELYLVTGQYDFVVILDAPDDETIARAMLAEGAKGNNRSQTFRAFSGEEIGRIINGLP